MFFYDRQIVMNLDMEGNEMVIIRRIIEIPIWSSCSQHLAMVRILLLLFFL